MASLFFELNAFFGGASSDVSGEVRSAGGEADTLRFVDCIFRDSVRISIPTITTVSQYVKSYRKTKEDRCISTRTIGPWFSIELIQNFVFLS